MIIRFSVMTLIGCLVSQQLVYGDEIELRVTMLGPTTPTSVTILQDGTLDEIALNSATTGRVYTASVNRPPTDQPSPIPYQLVATWSDGTEVLYLALNSTTSGKISIPVLHPIESSELATLDNIEALNIDLQSMLARYYRARAFHKKWRYEFQQPETQVALRSAKIWFDASANLAKRTNSYFRIDEEIKTIMSDYESKAVDDEVFRSRFRKYVGTGYISATLEQVYAAQYQYVGAIPKLVANQQLEEAQRLNDKAISALQNEPTSIRAIVSKHQGVDLDLLKANAAYISTLQEIKQ